MSDFQLSFKQLSHALADAHFIEPERRPAFLARLKHLQRLGFPPGSNTGKGKRASYNAEQFLLLGAGLELIQLGLTPERTVQILVSAQDQLLRECARRYADGRSRQPMLMYVDPRAFAEFQDEMRLQNNLRSALTLEFGTWDEVRQYFVGKEGTTRMAVVDLHRMIENLLRHLEWHVDWDVKTQFREWGGVYVQHS